MGGSMTCPQCGTRKATKKHGLCKVCLATNKSSRMLEDILNELF